MQELVTKYRLWLESEKIEALFMFQAGMVWASLDTVYQSCLADERIAVRLALITEVTVETSHMAGLGRFLRTGNCLTSGMRILISKRTVRILCLYNFRMMPLFIHRIHCPYSFGNAGRELSMCRMELKYPIPRLPEKIIFIVSWWKMHGEFIPAVRESKKNTTIIAIIVVHSGHLALRNLMRFRIRNQYR